MTGRTTETEVRRGPDEWDDWVDDWRDEPNTSCDQVAGEPGESVRPAPAGPDPAEVAKLRRRSHWFGLGLAFLSATEILCLAALLGWATWRAWIEPSVSRVALAAILWVICVVTEGVTLWNRRGTWRPADDTTVAFVRLSLLRARRQLRILRALPALVLFELALLVPYRILVGFEDPDRAIESWTRVALLVGGWLAVCAAAIWIYARGVRRKLRRIETLASELGLDEDDQG